MKAVIFAILAVVVHPLQSPTLVSKSGTVSFYSDAPLEKIEARNRKVLVKYNHTSGSLEISLLMKGFEFRKALMQEHFNENYVESHKYPKAGFRGEFDLKDLSLSNNKSYPVTASGVLTIHGVSHPLKVPGTITVDDRSITMKAEFNILLSDYNIRIPALVRNNISKTVKIMMIASDFK